MALLPTKRRLADLPDVLDDLRRTMDTILSSEESGGNRASTAEKSATSRRKPTVASTGSFASPPASMRNRRRE
jgi:hypothetical protein